MDLLTLVGKITLDTSEYEEGIDAAKSKAHSFGGGLTKVLGGAAKVGAAAVAAAAAAVGAIVKQSVDAFGEYEQLEGGVEKLYGTGGKSIEEYAASVGKSVDEVRGEYANLTKAQDLVMQNAHNAFMTAGMDANTYMQNATSFSAALINSLGGDTVKAAEQTDVAMRAISDNVNTFGSDMESVTNAFMGFSKQNYTMLDNLKLGYGGTKEEMERLIADANAYAAANGMAADLSIESFSDIVTAIQLIQEKQGVAGTTAKEAAKTIEGSFAATKAAWKNLLVAFGSGKDVKKAMKNFTDSAKNVIRNVIPVIKTALSGIGEFVKEIGPMIVTELPGLVKELLPGLLDAALSLAKSVAKSIPNLLKSIVSALGQFMDTLSSWLHEKSPVLGKAFDGLRDGAGKAFESIRDLWENTLKPAFTAIADFTMNTLAPAVISAWTEYIQPAIASVANWISETLIPFIVGAWTNYIQPVLTAAYTFITETVIPFIVAAWENTLKPTIEAIYKLVTEVVVPYIVAAWENILKPMLEAAYKFVTETVIPIIVTAWETVLQPALEAIRSFVVDTLVPAIITVWTEHLEPTINAVGALITSVWENIISPALEALKSFIIDTLAPAISTFWETTVQPIWNSIGSLIKTVWEETISPAWTALTEGISGLATSLTGFWEETVQPTWTAIGSTISTVWTEVIKPVWDAFSEAISTVVTALTSFWENTVTPVWEGIGSTISGAWNDTIKPAWDSVTSGIDGLKTTFDNFLRVVRSKFNAVKTAITTPLTTARNTVKSIVEKIQGFLSGNWTLPHIPTPHFSIGQGPVVLGVQLPAIEVKWEKKAYNNPYMFTKPTMMGFGDGVGGEIVYGHNNLLEDIKNAMRSVDATDDRPITIVSQVVLDGKIIGESVSKYQRNKARAYG